MSRNSNTLAFVSLAGILGAGVLAWNEALASADVSSGAQDQFDTVEQLLTTGGDLFGVLVFLAGILVVVAVLSGRL